MASTRGVTRNTCRIQLQGLDDTRPGPYQSHLCPQPVEAFLARLLRALSSLGSFLRLVPRAFPPLGR